ncbi:MAG: hypothetical protein ACP5HW_03275 [Candidatus Micrarchaeia archaeon]
MIIILILVVAAAGLMRGYNIFAMFGIPALLVNARGSFAGKNAAASTAAVRKGSKTGAAFNKLGSQAHKYANKAALQATTFGKIYANQLRLAKQSGLSGSQAAKAAYYRARTEMLRNHMKDVDEKLQDLNKSLTDIQKSPAFQKNKNLVDTLMKTQSSPLKGASMASSFQYIPSPSGGSKYVQFDTAATSHSMQNVERILSKGYGSGIDYKQDFIKAKAEYNNYMRNANNVLKSANELSNMIKKEIAKETLSQIKSNNPVRGIKMAVTAHKIQKNPFAIAGTPYLNSAINSGYDKFYLSKASTDFEINVKRLKASLNKEVAGNPPSKALPSPAPSSHYP